MGPPNVNTATRPVPAPEGFAEDQAPFVAAAPARQNHPVVRGRRVDAATLRASERTAQVWGVEPHEVLIATGAVDETGCYRALAASYGLGFLDAKTLHRLAVEDSPRPAREYLAAGALPLAPEHGLNVALAPEDLAPGALTPLLDKLAASGLKAAITTPRALRQIVAELFGARLVTHAVNGLALRFPGQSAHNRLSRGQGAWLLAVLVMVGVLAVVAPWGPLAFVTGLLTLGFLAPVALRLMAVADLMVSPPSTPAPALEDRDLPVYTLLVPLYGEANVIGGLIEALTGLDYPAAKLDIKLILEACDAETIAAVAAIGLPACFDVIVVPDAQPRTKPKALNYALNFARGAYAVIFDAEDRPEPDQLRKAAAAFAAMPEDVVCLQARLNFYNARESWLTRQFALEYAALFDALLPMLARLGLPLPLGGTSNHFETAALRELAAWDAHNVTEDADLGMRLARHGLSARTLQSTTYEEAVTRLDEWTRQRTRWIKGWVQTWLVHMRHPLRLWRDLGTAGFAAFHIVIGGTVVSALVHPWFYVLVALQVAGLVAGGPPAGFMGLHLWLLAGVNLAAGYGASMALAALAVRRRGLRGLARHALTMPVYWLLISLAAYRALGQFVTRPFYWEKTAHGLTKVTPKAGV